VNVNFSVLLLTNFIICGTINITGICLNKKSKGKITMKRTLSLLVVVVMLVSMFSFMTTGVSANVLKSTYEDAKDGDLLYEVKFGETSGVYTPTQFNAQTAGDTDAGAVTITDNGRTLAFYKPSLQSNASYYGGAIEGLKWTADTVYTITMKLSLPPNRGGVYFNFPTGDKKTELTGTTGVNDNTYNSVMYGIYGRFDSSGDLGAMKSGGKVAGDFRFDTAGYKEFEQIIVEEGTFLDVTFLIEGYSYAVFVEGGFLDVIQVPEADVKDIADDLGFSVYLWHIKENTPMIVKDVNIYKGNTITSKATYPDYAKNYKYYVAPVTTTGEPTTPAETTTKKEETPTTPAETTTAANTTAKNDVTTAAPKKDGGCGSAVTSGLALIALVSLAGVTVAKKRK